MTDFLQYGAVALWAVLAVLTFIIGRKQGAVGYMLSVFFVFMAVWYGLRAFGKLPVTESRKNRRSKIRTNPIKRKKTSKTDLHID